MVTSLTRLQLHLNATRIDMVPLARLTRVTYLALDLAWTPWEGDEGTAITCSSSGSPGSLPPLLRELHVGNAYLDGSACRALAGLPHLQVLTAASLRPSPLDPPVCLAGQNMQRLQLDGILVQDLPALVPCLNRCRAASVDLSCTLDDRGQEGTDDAGHASAVTQQRRALAALAGLVAPQPRFSSQQHGRQAEECAMDLRLSVMTQHAAYILMEEDILQRLPGHVALYLSLGSVGPNVIQVDAPMAATLAGCSSLSEFVGQDLEYTPDFLNGLLTAPLAGLTEQLVLIGTLDGPPGAAPIIIGMCLGQRSAQRLRPLHIGTDLLTEEEADQIMSQLMTLDASKDPEQVDTVDGWKAK